MADIKIKFKDTKGKERTIGVKFTDLISSAKEKVGDKGFVWKYNGEILKDDKTIEYYGFENEDVIVKGERVIGGKKSK